MSSKDRDLVRALMTKLKFRLSTRHGRSRVYALNAGTPQGAAEAPMCYAWLIEPVIRMLTQMAWDEDRVPGTGWRQGDVDLIATSVAGMQSQLDKLAMFYSWARMQLNVSGSDKTACMMFNIPERGEGRCLYWRQAGADGAPVQTCIPELHTDPASLPPADHPHYKYLGLLIAVYDFQRHAAANVAKLEASLGALRTHVVSSYQSVRLTRTYLTSRLTYGMQFAPFTPPLCRRADVLLQSAVKEGLWEGHGAFLCREAYTNPVSLYGMGLEPVSDLQDRLVVTVFMQDLNSEDVTVKELARAHLALYRAVGMDSRDEGFGVGRFLAVLRERGLEVVHPSPDVDPFVDAVPLATLREHGLSQLVAVDMAARSITGTGQLHVDGLLRSGAELGLGTVQHSELSRAWHARPELRRKIDRGWVRRRRNDLMDTSDDGSDSSSEALVQGVLYEARVLRLHLREGALDDVTTRAHHGLGYMLVTVRVGSALEDAGVRAGMFILSARGQSHGDEGSRHGGLRAHLGKRGARCSLATWRPNARTSRQMWPSVRHLTPAQTPCRLPYMATIGSYSMWMAVPISVAVLARRWWFCSPLAPRRLTFTAHTCALYSVPPRMAGPRCRPWGMRRHWRLKRHGPKSMGMPCTR